MLQRLENLALGVNTGNGNDDGENLETINASNIITDIMGKDNPLFEEFNCEIFFIFVSQDNKKQKYWENVILYE